MKSIHHWWNCEHHVLVWRGYLASTLLKNSAFLKSNWIEVTATYTSQPRRRKWIEILYTGIYSPCFIFAHFPTLSMGEFKTGRIKFLNNCIFLTMFKRIQNGTKFFASVIRYPKRLLVNMIFQYINLDSSNRGCQCTLKLQYKSTSC